MTGASLKAVAPSVTHPRSAALTSALATLETEAAGLAALIAAVGNGLGEAFEQAVATIMAARGRVIVTGMGKSGHVARKIAATFASTGTPSHYVHPAEASHGDLGMVAPEDVIVALSWSGETAELRDIVEYSQRFGVPLIALTANTDSALAKAASVVLALPQAREACPLGLAPTTSTLMQLPWAMLGGGAAGKPRLHRAGIPRVPSRRQAGGQPEVRPRRDAPGHRRAAGPQRRADGRGAGGDERQGPRLRSRWWTPTAASPASSPTAICAATWPMICPPAR